MITICKYRFDFNYSKTNRGIPRNVQVHTKDGI